MAKVKYSRSQDFRVAQQLADGSLEDDRPLYYIRIALWQDCKETEDAANAESARRWFALTEDSCTCHPGDINPQTGDIFGVCICRRR